LRLTSTNTNTVPDQVARSISEANLGAGLVRVSLQRVADAQVTDVMGLSNIADGKRTYLVLKNLHTWSQPEVLYHVYLTPGGASHDPGRASYVGAINFFDAEFHDHGNGDKGDVLGENFYSFDVTEILQGIAHSGRRADLRNLLYVTFVPAGTPTAGGNPMVGTIELARQ
jgi:tyrosinase